MADVPTVREGTSGSLLGDLADREGGTGGATGGALTGGVTFAEDGAAFRVAGAALIRGCVGGVGGVFGGVAGVRTGAGGGCGRREARSLLGTRLEERDLCSPTFL